MANLWLLSRSFVRLFCVVYWWPDVGSLHICNCLSFWITGRFSFCYLGNKIPGSMDHPMDPVHGRKDHKLVLRYRRSSAFLPPIFSFQLVNLIRGQEHIQFSYCTKRDIGGGRLPDNITHSSPFMRPHPRWQFDGSKLWQLPWNDQVSTYCSYPQSTPVLQAIYSRKTLLYYPA